MSRSSTGTLAPAAPVLDVADDHQREVRGVDEQRYARTAGRRRAEDGLERHDSASDAPRAGCAERSPLRLRSRGGSRRRCPPASRIRSSCPRSASSTSASTTPTSCSTSAAPLRTVVSSLVERRSSTARDVATGRHERLAGGLAHPPRSIAEKRDDERRGRNRRDRGGGAAGLRADERMGSSSSRSAHRSASPDATAEGLERGRADVRRRSAVMRGTWRGRATRSARAGARRRSGRRCSDAREAAAAAPARGASRSSWPGHWTGLSDLLTSASTRPSIAHSYRSAEAAEGRDAGETERRLVAPERAQQDLARVSSSFSAVAEPGLVERLLRHAPLGVAGVELRRHRRLRAEATAEHGENEQRPGAARIAQTSTRPVRPSIPPHVGTPNGGHLTRPGSRREASLLSGRRALWLDRPWPSDPRRAPRARAGRSCPTGRAERGEDDPGLDPPVLEDDRVDVGPDRGCRRR